MGGKQIRDGNLVAANLMIQGEYYVWLRKDFQHSCASTKSGVPWRYDVLSAVCFTLSVLVLSKVVGSESHLRHSSGLTRGKMNRSGLTLAVALAWYSGQPFTVIVSCMYWYTWKHEERRLLQDATHCCKLQSLSSNSSFPYSNSGVPSQLAGTYCMNTADWWKTPGAQAHSYCTSPRESAHICLHALCKPNYFTQGCICWQEYVNPPSKTKSCCQVDSKSGVWGTLQRG